jgi:hypothetical protein
MKDSSWQYDPLRPEPVWGRVLTDAVVDTINIQDGSEMRT